MMKVTPETVRLGSGTMSTGKRISHFTPQTFHANNREHHDRFGYEVVVLHLLI